MKVEFQGSPLSRYSTKIKIAVPVEIRVRAIKLLSNSTYHLLPLRFPPPPPSPLPPFYLPDAKKSTINKSEIIINLFSVLSNFQKLRPTDPPIFEIKHLLINETGTQLVLWGNLGLVIMELPKRWGKDCAFQGGKKEIRCM